MTDSCSATAADGVEGAEEGCEGAEGSCKDMSIPIREMRDDQSSNGQKPKELVSWEKKSGQLQQTTTPLASH
ncbi:hypothetical protein N7451_006777 [Penicillium sp. IBT 35674x]|nr:hypothetical protein N7451_006777 [Penicillium sp. IBT 35674x]